MEKLNVPSNENNETKVDEREAMRNELRFQMELEDERKKREQSAKRQLIFRDVIIFILLLIIALLIIFRKCNCGCNCGNKGSNAMATERIAVSEVEDNSTSTPSTEPSTPVDAELYVTMPVVTNFTNEVTLYCPKENEGLFEISYTFTNVDTNEVLYQSSWLKAGDEIPVNFKSKLSKGNYNVRVSIASRYLESGKNANGAGSTVVLTIK